MATINLATFIVLAIGTSNIDHEATLSKFAGELHKFEAERMTENATLGLAVKAVFDQYKGVNLNMPAITSMALTRMNVQPENFKILTDKVQDYIRENAGTRASGALFSIAKGKGGGVRRWSDCPLTEKEVKEAQDAQAAEPVPTSPAPESEATE